MMHGMPYLVAAILFALLGLVPVLYARCRRRQ